MNYEVLPHIMVGSQTSDTVVATESVNFSLSCISFSVSSFQAVLSISVSGSNSVQVKDFAIYLITLFK